jgi:type II secretory pathway pseudopilin PulG
MALRHTLLYLSLMSKAKSKQKLKSDPKPNPKVKLNSDLKNEPALSNTKEARPKDFRGLTIFELTIILSIIGATLFWALSLRSNLQNKVYDAERKGRVAALKEAMHGYFLENNTFPSEESFNDDKTRTGLFNAYSLDNGEDYFKDPKDKSKLINYIPQPEGCTGETGNICNKASISLDLSSGEEFTQFAIEPGKELEFLQESIDQGDTELNQEEFYNSILSDPEPGD